MATKLIDTSIFRGIIEFETTLNIYRFELEGSGIWKRYVKRHNAFVFDGRVKIIGQATPQKLLVASDPLGTEVH